MKVRIQGNSLRFRLKQPEVKRLGKERFLKETVEFGASASDQLSFVLAADNSNSMTINYTNSTITVTIPNALIDEWIQTDLVGFDEKIKTEKGKEIKVLVEKDFACLDGSEEENAGTYPNPLKNC